MPFQKGHQNYNKGRGVGATRVSDLEQKFLLAYYDEDSETKGNGAECARLAGFSESVALTQSTRILRKYEKHKFQKALEAVGVNNLMMAFRLKTMIRDGADKDAINAIRLALAAKGEATDQQAAQGNVFNAPVMIIQGMTKGRLEALKGQIPQLSPEMQETLENQRVEENLRQLRSGELEPIRRHSRAKHEETDVLNIDSDHDIPSGKADNPAG